jgi:hypothetical protein
MPDPTVHSDERPFTIMHTVYGLKMQTSHTKYVMSLLSARIFQVMFSDMKAWSSQNWNYWAPANNR